MELSSDTTNLLRPNQVTEMREEIGNLEEMLSAPPHIRSQITDRGMMNKRLGRLRKELDTFAPRAFAPSERDAAVKEFAALSDTIRIGMPSSEEMRRNPPGAVGKQTTWEKRQKKSVQRYKYLALRLLAGGDLPAHLDHAGDVANIEMLRPLKTNRDVSMDGAQIPKTTDFHIGNDPVGTVLFTDAETALLQEVHPEISGSLAVLGNEARARIKEILAGAAGDGGTVLAPETVKAEKPELSELNFLSLQQLAKKNGMNTFQQSKSAVASWLRARHIIR